MFCFFYLSVDNGKEIGYETGFRAVIHDNGNVYWTPGFRWRTTCRVDLTYFPFDTQICYIELSNWIYTSQLVNLTLGTEQTFMAYYHDNSAFEVEFEGFTRIHEYNDIERPSFRIVGLKLKLRRRPAYFVLNIVMPTLIISLLSLYVYLLPAESGEKVTLGITVVLSYSVLLLMISDITPPSGENQPLLCEYTAGLLFQVILAF